jgi:hypothetical protein
VTAVITQVVEVVNVGTQVLVVLVELVVAEQDVPQQM